MAASVRIEDEAFADARIAALGGLAGYNHFEALGRMAHLWRLCTQRGVYVVSEVLVCSCLGRDGVAAIIGAELGERVEGGIRIKGTDGRIEWLEQLRSTSSAGGRARSAKALRDGGRYTSRRPADRLVKHQPPHQPAGPASPAVTSRPAGETPAASPAVTSAPAPAPAPALSILFYSARDKTRGDLSRRLEAEYGYARGLIRSKWVPLAESLEPYSLAEIDQAIAEARAKDRPSAGLVIRMIESGRGPPEKPGRTQARAPPHSAFREATEQAMDDARRYDDDQRRIREADVPLAGVLPAKSR